MGHQDTTALSVESLRLYKRRCLRSRHEGLELVSCSPIPKVNMHPKLNTFSNPTQSPESTNDLVQFGQRHQHSHFTMNQSSFITQSSLILALSSPKSVHLASKVSQCCDSITSATPSCTILSAQISTILSSLLVSPPPC